MEFSTRSVRTIDALSILTVLCVAVVAGCSNAHVSSSSRPQNPDDKTESEFHVGLTRIIDDRFLVAEVTIGPKSRWELTGSFPSMSKVAYRRSADLMIVDLDTGRHDHPFKDRALIHTWSGYVGQNDGRTVFPGYLIIDAMAEDSNQDGRIDVNDRKSMYTYNLASQSLTEICPTDYELTRDVQRGDRLILVLRKLTSGAIAVYDVDPTTGKGRFIADGLVP